MLFFFFKQKTAYEIYQCDWSSDVCSSDLCGTGAVASGAISYALGKVKRMPISIKVKGGSLKVNLHYNKGVFSDVFLEGDAQIIYKGKLVYENS